MKKSTRRRQLRQPYIARILNAHAAGLIGPGLHLAVVLHSPECRRPFGGLCTCTPEVRLRRVAP